MTAGGPVTNDVLKCQLKPLSRVGLQRRLHRRAQWARLQHTFPSGVCDYSKRGVMQQPPTAPWLTFAGGSRRNAARPTTDGALRRGEAAPLTGAQR